MVSRLAIAAKAQVGISPERIIRDLNKTVLNNGQVTRKQMITKKDVRNITQSSVIMSGMVIACVCVCACVPMSGGGVEEAPQNFFEAAPTPNSIIFRA